MYSITTINYCHLREYNQYNVEICKKIVNIFMDDSVALSFRLSNEWFGSTGNSGKRRLIGRFPSAGTIHLGNLKLKTIYNIITKNSCHGHAYNRYSNIALQRES
jgi:hypothetical protein